jgi:hypothetical protein
VQVALLGGWTMTAQEIRESSSKLVDKWVGLGKDLQPVAVQSGIYAALVEIAAQLAEFNEQGDKFREIVRVWAREKGLIR